MKRFIFNGDTYDSSEEATDAVYAFAHDTFDEYLDECFEEIHIGSLTYTPSHVLKKTDPIAYRCMLSDYENCLGYRMGSDEKIGFRITTPKTAAGTRTIPMLKAVKEALLQIREMQLHLGGSKISIDGHQDFVFVSSAGRPYVLKTINAAIKRILRDYEQEDTKRVAEGLPSRPIRPFTSHNLRHTFCTRFCENETNLKVIQSIMGHSDIQTTMDIYAEATEAKKNEAIANLEGRIFI